MVLWEKQRQLSMTKPMTQKRLYNITLFYLSKYEASSEKVRQMLRRRLEKAVFNGEEIPVEAPQWIENIIQKMITLHYIDDSRYTENQVRILSSQGKSENFIICKLQQSGISADLTRSFLEKQDESDIDRAVNWLKHHRKGGFRTHFPQTDEEIRLIYQKDMAALGRAGFSYQTAKEALSQSQVIFPDANE